MRTCSLLLLPFFAAVMLFLLGNGGGVSAFTSTPFGVRPDLKNVAVGTTLTMTTDDKVSPSTFREAEVLGLKLMQQQKYEEALKGTCSVSLLSCSKEGRPDSRFAKLPQPFNRP